MSITLLFTCLLCFAVFTWFPSKKFFIPIYIPSVAIAFAFLLFPIPLIKLILILIVLVAFGINIWFKCGCGLGDIFDIANYDNLEDFSDCFFPIAPLIFLLITYFCS
jgi:hypothetical protein